MGGINHQPTSQVSLALSVPAAEALTQSVAELMLGNVAIERLVELSGTTHFGVGRQRLVEASGHFKGVVTQLEIVRSYVNRILDTVGNPEYNPFDLSDVDVDTLISGAIAAGMLPDAQQVKEAIQTTKSGGYSGVFFAIGDLVDLATDKATKLHELTESMVDGPEGTQGYFWANVEANRNSWRQDFMSANTALMNLLTFWATTAAICTEVHLKGTGAPSLLAHTNVRA